MGSVYRKIVTKEMPAGARIIDRDGQRLARWQNAKGKTRTAPVTVGQDGADRIVVIARTYIAKYRDGSGHVREVRTGCKDEVAARSVLNNLEKRADKVRSKLRTAAEDAVVDHQQTSLGEHVDAFMEHQRAKGVTKAHLDTTRSRLERVAKDCSFEQLADLDAIPLKRWLVARQAEGMGAVTRNGYREAWVTFGNWCVENHRLLSNPYSSIPKADAKADPRRKRRSMTEAELVKLLEVARTRPLQDRMTVARGDRKGKQVAKVSDVTRIRLERVGRERALIYKTLVLTGLRKSELASLTVRHLVLDAEQPYLTLNAADEKNRNGSSLPIRSDLADDLRDWLAAKAEAMREGSEPPESLPLHHAATVLKTIDLSRFPFGLPADTPLFNVPDGLVKILDRDLVAAGIAKKVEGPDGKVRIDKRDDRGRSLDVHALRTTFGTLMSQAGVAPRTAQAAMRHSDIHLTMNVYTDPRLLDVAGAVEALPELPLKGRVLSESKSPAWATGTDDARAEKFAPKFAPTIVHRRQREATTDKASSLIGESADEDDPAASASPVNDKDPLTTAVNGSSEVGVTGFEPATSWSRIGGLFWAKPQKMGENYAFGRLTGSEYSASFAAFQ